MKIFKWVPVSNEQKKTKHKDGNKENIMRKVTDSSNSNFSLAEDSNTCKLMLLILFRKKIKCFCLGFSTVSDSQGPTDFSSSHMTFSEDSNSQGSEPPVKRLKTD